MQKCDIKIGVFGDGSSEKTLLTLSFLKNNDDFDSNSDSFMTKEINVGGTSVNLTIFDTGESDVYSEMRFKYYSSIQAAILVFDISDPGSINTIKSFHGEIRSEYDVSEMPIVIAANRGYLRDQNTPNLTSPDKYSSLEESLNCKVFETNTKTGKNVQDIFHYVINQYLNSSKNGQDTSKKGSSKSQNKNDKKKKSSDSNVSLTSSSSSPINFPSSTAKEKFPSFERGSRNSKILDKSKISMSPPDLKKRSSLVLPRNFPKNNEINPGPTEVFSSPMGDEIKKILQSRTKQLQQALDEKKQLEQQLKQKDEELKKAYERIKELESQLENNCEESAAKKQKKKSKSRSKTLDERKRVHFHKNENLKLKLFERDDIDSFEKVDEIDHQNFYDIFKINDEKSDRFLIVFDIKQNCEELFKQIQILNQLDCPNMVKFYGYCLGDESNKPSLICEYVPHKLTDVLKKLSNEEKVSVIWQIANALKKSHSLGISHLNLCPSAVFVDDENNAKVTNFCIVSFLNLDSQEAVEKTFPSSFMYMAPEMQSCGDFQKEKVDVYSFGVVVYFVLSNGEFPKVKKEAQYAVDLSEFPDCVNECSSRLIRMCCNEDAGKRPSFDEIVRYFESDSCLIDGVDAESIKNRLIQK